MQMSFGTKALLGVGVLALLWVRWGHLGGRDDEVGLSDVVALDIVLLPPAHVNDQAVKANQVLRYV